MHILTDANWFQKMICLQGFGLVQCYIHFIDHDYISAQVWQVPVGTILSTGTVVTENCRIVLVEEEMSDELKCAVWHKEHMSPGWTPVRFERIY